MSSETPEEDVLVLGGQIELSGFSGLDGGTMVVLKKIVGNYTRKISERFDDFEKLSLKMKKVHEKEKSEKYELHGMIVINGKQYNTEITDRNLFFAVDKAFKKLDSMLEKI